MTKKDLLALVAQGASRSELIDAINKLETSSVGAGRGDKHFTQIFGDEPKVGDKVTLAQAFDRASIAIDARTLYQWRKKGYIVERVDKGELTANSEYVYQGFRADKAEEYYASQKAKREAKKGK